MAEIKINGMIRICVGISNLTPGWNALLQQSGVEFEHIDFAKNLNREYSILIINSKLEREELTKVQSFIKRNSGGVLFSARSEHPLIGNTTPSQVPVSLPREYAVMVKFLYLETGLIARLSFDPDAEISNNSFRRKRFTFKTRQHPDEIVSSINKKAVLDTVDTILRALHTHRKLPYITKWHSPAKKPVFGFRIDSDYGDKKSIKSIYTLAKKYSIPMTWFLHIQAHEDWLDHFKSFEDQEIALHGYEHGTSKSYEHLINNIERGKQLMIDAGITPTGFCAPYGIWNETLADVLREFNFQYSSEFTIGYDTLPFHPVVDDGLHPTLQIPIHPICTGNLNRRKVTEEEMESYFLNIFDEKINRNENVFFYHHPLQPGLNVWKPVFDRVNNEKLIKITFSGFAKFWKQRLNSSFEAFFNPEKMELNCESSHPSMWLKISMNNSNYYLLEASKTDKPLNSFDSFEISPFREVSHRTVKELTGNRVQLMKTSVLDWRNRKKL